MPACCAAQVDRTAQLEAEQRPEGAVDPTLDVPDDREPPGSSSQILMQSIRIPASEPGRPPTGFVAKVRLERGQEAGFALDYPEGLVLRICQLFPKGPVHEYNASAPPERRIRIGDFIVSVKGPASGGEDAQCLVTALQKGGDVEMEIRRPLEFATPDLDKKGGSVGLDLSYHPRGSAVVVRGLFSSGAVPEYNKTAPQARTVRVHDYIVSVNGRTGTAKALVQAMSEQPRVSIVIARPMPV